jgi:hypothetical protein
MEITFYCQLVNLNWSAVTELPSRLRKFGLEVKRSSLDLHRYPKSVGIERLDDISEYVKANGSPRHFSINLRGDDGKGQFWLAIYRGTADDGWKFLKISLTSESPEDALKSVVEFLELRPAEPVQLMKELARTAFIAHRFDEPGQEAADKVARFLSLLGFDCATGRGYAPGSVAEKVRSRLTSQAIVVVILTPGDDSTWLVQESLLSSVSGKPLIILKESKADFKPALLSDHEFIPFSGKRVEQAFIPLLEGLKALAYKFEGG